MDAYPQVRVHDLGTSRWYTLSIVPVRGLDRYARIAFTGDWEHRIPSAWGWWDDGIWIGSRHTNFPDGSICAFEVRDLTWHPGKPLEELVDLWSLWVVRQMHLAEFGFWPGAQALHTPHERLTEHRPNELCGCGTGRLYHSCCRESDIAVPYLDRLLQFTKAYRGGRRQPPAEVSAILAR